MLTIPEAFSNAGYFLGFDRPLWYVAMIATYISGVVFLVRTKRAEAVSKQWYLAFALFSFFYATTRLLFNLAVEFGMAIVDDGKVYDDWCGLGYISAIAGAIYILYVAEKNIITSTRKICTIMLVVGLGASILGVVGVYPREYTLIITYAVSLLATVLILFIYIVMIRNSTGALRKKTVGAFIGIIIWFVSIILDGEVAYTAIAGMPLLLSPLMYLIGVILYTIFQRAG